MPPKPTGERPLTGAERQARIRSRQEAERMTYREALERIDGARTIREARKIASDALEAWHTRHPAPVGTRKGEGSV